MIKQFLLAAAFTTACVSVKAQSSHTTIPTEINDLLQKHTCYTCHKADKKMVGPSWMDIAAKKYTAKQIVVLVGKPKPEDWPGYSAMAALPTVPKADLTKIATWIKTLEQ